MKFMNQYDNNNQRHGIWEIELYSSKEIGFYIHGKKEGEWRFYLWSNEDNAFYVKEITTYKNNLKHGLHKVFNEKGEVTSFGNYHEDEKIGSWYHQVSDIRTAKIGENVVGLGNSIWLETEYQHIPILTSEVYPIDKLDYEVSIDKDEKGRTIKVYLDDIVFNKKFNKIFGEVTYNDKDEIISYKDYKGNWYDKKFFKKNCTFDINNLYHIHFHIVKKGRREYNQIRKQLSTHLCT